MNEPVPHGYGASVVPHGCRGPYGHHGATWGPPDPSRDFFAGRRRRSVAAAVVACAGFVALLLTVIPQALAQSTVGMRWATWTTIVAASVLFVAAITFVQMNNPHVLREPAATLYALWTTRTGAGAGAVGVASSIVVLWAARSEGRGALVWWLTATPGLLLVGTCLVLWLGAATLRGLRAAPEGLLDARAAEQDLVWLRKAFDPGWRSRIRVATVVATLLGLPVVGVMAVVVASYRGAQLAVLMVFLLVMAGACIQCAALDVSAPEAAQRAMSAGMTFVVGGLGFFVSRFVGAAATGGPVPSVVWLPLLGMVVAVSTIGSAVQAVGRARRGVLGPETAAWVAAQDAARAGTLHR